ncbi:hypothetical protein MMC28_004909 [Mycoblastus sanguinarius]|nr:hypothetical protein [Mycoblastus sanguinarius]
MTPEQVEAIRGGGEAPQSAEYQQPGPYWTLLQNRASEAIQDASQGRDEDLMDVIIDSFEHIPNDPHRSAEQIILRRISLFLDRIGQRARDAEFSARNAALYLAGAQWDEDQALVDYFSDVESKALTPEEPPGPGDLTPHQMEMRRLNPNIDRSPAMLNREDRSLLTITLNTPKGTTKTSKHKWINNMNFGDAENVRELNRWRSQLFRRQFGLARPPRIAYQPSERQWLTNRHRQYEQQRIAAGDNPGQVDWTQMDWNQITADFNSTFAGRLVPGSSVIRPTRTRESLRSDRSRIPAICQMTGLTLRSERGAARNPGDDEEEEVEEQPRSKRGGKGSGPSKRARKG